jgi:hypothetical protein
MMRLKICLLGATAVGKTSLARRFVEGVFSDRYLTTVGVRIDKRVVRIDGQEIHLIVWDLSGEDEFAQVQTRYLRGASAGSPWQTELGRTRSTRRWSCTGARKPSWARSRLRCCSTRRT